MNNTDYLVPAFKESLFNEALSDVTIDIFEVGIDSILEGSFLEKLPFFNILIGSLRAARGLQERNMLKNTAVFLNTINSKKIDEKKLSQYKEKLKDEKVAEKELGRVLILLNQYVDNIKSRMLGIVFWKYVNEEYAWNKFCELSDIVSRVFIDDIEYLKEISESPEKKKQYHIYSIPYNIKRLESLGLLELYGEYNRFGDTILQKENMFVALTANGKIFLELDSKDFH